MGSGYGTCEIRYPVFPISLGAPLSSIAAVLYGSSSLACSPQSNPVLRCSKAHDPFKGALDR